MTEAKKLNANMTGKEFQSGMEENEKNSEWKAKRKTISHSTAFVLLKHALLVSFSLELMPLIHLPVIRNILK